MTMRDAVEALAESDRVERTLAAIGYDRIAIGRVQQEIADLHTTTTLSWHEATERIMDRILAGGAPLQEGHPDDH